MKVCATPLQGALVLEPKIFRDERGCFFESWNERTFLEAAGLDIRFVQDNHSFSHHHVLRGLHYRVNRPEGKLVRVVSGSVFDVIVDVRSSSPTFGQWFGTELSADNAKVLWIPPGLAHGYVVRSACATFLYKTTEFYETVNERCIVWNDPDLGIGWGCDAPLVAEKDKQGALFKNAETCP